MFWKLLLLGFRGRILGIGGDFIGVYKRRFIDYFLGCIYLFELAWK